LITRILVQSKRGSWLSVPLPRPSTLDRLRKYLTLKI